MCPSPRKAVLACALVFLVQGTLRADRIELRTGEVLVGKILRNNQEEVSIQLATGGVLSFKWSAIRRVRKGTETYEKSEEVPRAGAPTERPAAKKKTHAPKKPAVARPSQPVTNPPPWTNGRTADKEPVAGPVKGPVTRKPSPEEVEAAESSITDAERGFSVAPPKGFVPRPESRSEVVPMAFVDPFTRATFTVSAYPSSDTVLQVKKSTLRSLTENFSSFRVLRDEKLRRDGKDAEPEAWVVEVESKVGATSVRQLQVFTRSERCVVILSYSATLDSYPRHEEAFAWSLLSYRAVPATPGPEAEDPKG
jgi:hypothetical protein